MNTDTVSVIIPCYNAEKTISRCIGSILEQTYRPIEILVIDDGSTDDSFAVLQEMERSNDNIKIFRQSNHGISHARNVGLSEATGSFVSFVDADDHVERDYIRALYEAITTEKADLAVCRYRSKLDTDNDGFESACSVLNADEMLREIMMPKQNIASFVWNRLYKAEIIKKFDIKFNDKVYACEDTLFNYLYLEHVSKIAVCNDALYNYDINEESTMFKKSFNHRKISANLAFDIMLERAADDTAKKYIKVAMMWYDLILKRQAYRNHAALDKEEIDMINRRLRIDPVAFIKSEVGLKYKLAYPFWAIR